MKSAGLRVRTGVRAPAQVDPFVAADSITLDEYRALNPAPPLVPLIRCAARTKAGEPCGVCWYCKVSRDPLYPFADAPRLTTR